MPTMIRDNVELYYEVQGEGRPLVFTHGASWNHKQWHPQVEYFSKSFKTVIWDVRGHGYSTLPEGKTDSEDFNRDLIALLDFLKIGKATLCGLSMGGHISLQTAIRYPSRVEALILIGTPFTNTFNWFEKVFVPVNRFFNRLLPLRISAKLQAKMLSKFNPRNKEYIEEAYSFLERDSWNRIWDTVTRMESGADLEKVKCPTLLLLGDHDNLVRRQQQTMLEKIKGAELKIIEKAHHSTNLDNPDQVNKEIEDFLLRNNIR
ncbi:MAG: alpha/beta fold hydrolase [Desulfitobacteriia bacterium]|jgi:3-oxoadipate enol-lactonase